MRVTRARNLVRDERGASAVIVGICIVMLFAFATYAIDAGALWEDRRNVINASDAAALAAAQEYATGGNGCAGVDDTYAGANDIEVEEVVCEPSNITSLGGFVTVTATAPVDYTFAGIIGVLDRTVSSTTSASYEVAQSVIGLRPFGLCENIALQLQFAEGPLRVYFDPETQLLEGNPSLVCPDNPDGNWGLIDLDDSVPLGTPDLKEWITGGYDGSVEPGLIGGDTGFRSALSSAIPEIVSTTGNEKPFCLPIFGGSDEDEDDDGTDGHGANATFNVIGFAAVTLWSFEWQGSQDAYLELQLEDGALCAAGEAGDFPAVDFGARTVRICDVDFADRRSEC